MCFPLILSFVMDWPDLHWSLHNKYLQDQNSKSSSDLYSHDCHPCVHGLDGGCDHPLRTQDGLEECPCRQPPWCYQVNKQSNGFCPSLFCLVNLETVQNIVWTKWPRNRIFSAQKRGLERKQQHNMGSQTVAETEKVEHCWLRLIQRSSVWAH